MDDWKSPLQTGHFYATGNLALSRFPSKLEGLGVVELANIFMHGGVGIIPKGMK